ncbi:MAG: hypothetical protein RL651_1213 [Pseudomonadota bacterium]|jgi:succinate dehydrogenase/fumarate reductase flavoprotein subunit
MNTKSKPLTEEQERSLLLNAREIAEISIDPMSSMDRFTDSVAFEREFAESKSSMHKLYENLNNIDEFIKFCAGIDILKKIAEDEANYYRGYAGLLREIAELLSVATTQASKKTKTEVIDLLTGSDKLIAKISDIGGKLARVQTAKKAAIASYTKNSKRASKQAAKAGVREWWERWQSDPSMYEGKAAFARVMCDKFPVLESTQVIERWCTKWQRNRSPE